MTRYAMIDANSGYVWGVEEAADAVSACRQMDEALGADGRDYEWHGPNSNAHRGGRTAYLVHEVADAFDVANGQDPAEIAAVEAMPRVAIVTVE